MAVASGDARHNLQAFSINDRYAARTGSGVCIIADPKVPLVRLQANTRGFEASANVGYYSPRVGINHGDFIDERHADKESLVGASLCPVFTRTLQHDEGQ